MFQGFYNLTSSMLTQTRNLNVISNNMANVSTTGYKSDKMVINSFEEEMMYRGGDKSMEGAVQIGEMGKIVYANRNYTDFTVGAVEPSNSNLDMALMSEGFFTIETDDGEVYTRNGSFSIDDEGYMVINGIGRVMGEEGPIEIFSDNISVDAVGNVYNGTTGELIDKLSIVTFENYEEDITKGNNGVYDANAEPVVMENPTIRQKALEGSNVNAVKQMTEMMSSSRTLQSSAQILTMYDELMSKIVNNIGRP